MVASETCPCNFHPLGWLRASALTCRLISLVSVKWSCLRINKQAFPPSFPAPAPAARIRGLRWRRKDASWSARLSLRSDQTESKPWSIGQGMTYSLSTLNPGLRFSKVALQFMPESGLHRLICLPYSLDSGKGFSSWTRPVTG